MVKEACSCCTKAGTCVPVACVQGLQADLEKFLTELSTKQQWLEMLSREPGHSRLSLRLINVCQQPT